MQQLIQELDFGMVVHLAHMQVTFRCQGHILKIGYLATWPSIHWLYMSKVKAIPWSNSKGLTFYRQVGGGPSTERHSSLIL